MLQVMLWNESYQDQSKRHVLPVGLSQSVCFGEQSVLFLWSAWEVSLELVTPDWSGRLALWLAEKWTLLKLWRKGYQTMVMYHWCISAATRTPHKVLIHHSFLYILFLYISSQTFFIMFKLLLLNSSSVFLKVFQRFSLDMGCFVTYF